MFLTFKYRDYDRQNSAKFVMNLINNLMNHLKKQILLLFSFAVFHSYAQIGPASLSVGADEVLFQKGVLDVELLGEIISEKQDEVKKELVKRILLNETFSKGPYLTYHYANQILNTLLEHKDKNVIKKSLLENSAELAIVLGITEAYLIIRRKQVDGLDSLFHIYKNVYNDKSKSKDNLDNLGYTTSEGVSDYLPRIQQLYKLKEDSLINGNQLNYVLSDLFLEVCRNNVDLQKLGFFQKEFDELSFQKNSKYHMFLASDTSKMDTLPQVKNAFNELRSRLDAIYKEVGEIISINLKYSNIILNPPLVADTTTSNQNTINSLSKLLLDSLKSLSYNKVSSLSEKEQEVIDELSHLIYYASSTKNTQQDELHRIYDVTSLGANRIIPKVIPLIPKFNGLNTLITNLDSLAKEINKNQYAHLLKELKDSLGINNLDDVKKNFALLFNVVTNLDDASSYNQIAKLISSVGNMFPTIANARLMSDIASLEKYIIIDQDSNKVDIRVEDLIVYLSEKYMSNLSSDVSFHFTVGFNYLPSYRGEQFSFAAEKIGLRVKVIDFYKKRVFEDRHFIEKQNPLVEQLYVLFYGSGLLYQVQALQTETEHTIDKASFGGALGIRFFNHLDAHVGGAFIQINDKRKPFLTTGFEIPITEYLSRLGKKKQAD